MAQMPQLQQGPGVTQTEQAAQRPQSRNAVSVGAYSSATSHCMSGSSAQGRPVSL